MKYDHKFNDGDIVADFGHKEIFRFNDHMDGYRAQTNPDLLIHADVDKMSLFLKSDFNVIDFDGNKLA